MAVVSQPHDRGALCKTPGNPDEELGEFWEDDPWEIMAHHNLSGFERNRTFLNLAGKNFVDISSLTRADTDGDSRAAVAADLNNDGRMDLVVRQVGGGPLKIYENHFPQQHYLDVSLRGTVSNRLGIGARLTAFVGGRKIVRELYPVNSFHSQVPCRVHFGLGDADRVDRLTVRWPSGKTQHFSEIAADRHLVIEEGSKQIETVKPGQTFAP